MQQAADLITQVRAGDYERFLAIQLASADKRAALYAVTAFSVELGRIAETVSEAMIGQIKLAWWREALEEIIAGGAPRNHPVVGALAAVYAQQPAVFAPLLQMVEARGCDLDESLLVEEAGWLAYLDGTAGALHHAWALILDADTAQMLRAEIEATARGYAMVGLLRAIPYMAAQGFVRFPQARLDAEGVNTLRPSVELNRFVAHMLSEAQAHFTTQNALKNLRPIFALTRLAQRHQKSIIKNKYNVYEIKKMALSLVICVTQLKFI